MKAKLAALGNHKSEILLGVCTFGVGLGLGYFLGKRSKEPTYQVIPEMVKDETTPAEDIQESVVPTSQAVKDFIAEKLEQQQVHEGAAVIVEIEGEDGTLILGETHNVFAHSDRDWNFEEELAKRTKHTPYIIHKDEFFEVKDDEDREEYTQSVLTYYAGDDILVDEDNSPVYNHHDIVGDLDFGHGSSDPNVVYIRNDKRKAEFEVVRDSGMYSVEVLGLEIEDNQRAKHLNHTAIPRFRDD